MASNVSQNTSLSGLSDFESVLNALRTYLAFLFSIQGTSWQEYNAGQVC